MSDFVNSVIAQAIREKINLLEDQNLQRKTQIQLANMAMEENAEKLQRIVEDIEALRRYYVDVRERIDFDVEQNKNAEWDISENNKAIAELKAELAPAKTEPEIEVKTEPNPTRKPKTQFGELTPQQMNDTFDKYEILLKLRGTQRFEYIQFLRSKGYPESDTNISLSLGKCVGWLGNLVGQAKRRGMNIEDK